MLNNTILFQLLHCRSIIDHRLNWNVVSPQQGSNARHTVNYSIHKSACVTGSPFGFSFFVESATLLMSAESTPALWLRFAGVGGLVTAGGS